MFQLERRKENFRKILVRAGFKTPPFTVTSQKFIFSTKFIMILPKFGSFLSFTRFRVPNRDKGGDLEFPLCTVYLTLEE